MKEFKGTKGEWHIEGTHIISENGIEICDTYPVTYFLTAFEVSNFKAEENAKLIAAAPELLDRLNKLVLSVKAHPEYVFGEDGDEWHDLISLSEQAIKKAI